MDSKEASEYILLIIKESGIINPISLTCQQEYALNNIEQDIKAYLDTHVLQWWKT
jgi:hypothetical protein